MEQNQLDGTSDLLEGGLRMPLRDLVYPHTALAFTVSYKMLEIKKPARTRMRIDAQTEAR
jgi:hypothetical protein